MEQLPPRRESIAPPPGTGERGFDTLHTPEGLALIGFSILLFALICYWGSRWVKNVSKAGEAERRDLKAQLLTAKQDQIRREGGPL